MEPVNPVGIFEKMVVIKR